MGRDIKIYITRATEQHFYHYNNSQTLIPSISEFLSDVLAHVILAPLYPVSPDKSSFSLFEIYLVFKLRLVSVVWKAMESFVTSGKVVAVGLSNAEISHLLHVQSIASVPVR
jgi:diketogulonate reductase-like aldo/keto reductase